MSASEILTCQRRERLGTRHARRLRAEGRIPASIQAAGKDLHVDFSIDEHEFLATRRHHTHLYDLDIGGEQHSAVVRELQWDAFGEHVLHIEFKAVSKFEKTEVDVPLVFVGHPKGGLLNQLVSELTVRCLPADIPDSVEHKIDQLVIGTALHASDLALPEGVELVSPADALIAVIVEPKKEVVEPVAPVEGEAAPGVAEPKAEGPAEGEKKPES
jgi:large subunit ribosomal protein L25